MTRTKIKCIISVAALLMLIYTNAHSQVYMTRTGFIGFYSKMPLEDIRAENNQVFAAIDTDKKNIAFSLLLRGFVFTKELMQEHFNENYVESDRYPKATFSGSFTGDVDLTKDGVYRVMVKGNLNLHNVTHPLEAPGTIEVKGGKLLGQAEFKVRPEDYNITIPSLVRDKIAQEMRVNVKIECSTNK
jgi:polyisoprenoid-binding protein YceI